MPGLLFRLRPQNLPSQHPLPTPFRCLRTSAILNPPVTLFHFQSSLSFGYEAWRVLTIPAVATVTALVARARRDQCACAPLGALLGSLPRQRSFLSALSVAQAGHCGTARCTPGSSRSAVASYPGTASAATGGTEGSRA